MSERLNEIKENITEIACTVLIIKSDYDWLIEQVEEKEQTDTVYIVMREEDDGTTRPYRSYKTCERASEAANSLTKMYAEEEDDINGGCRFYVESLYLEG
ncbi:hypothetical protein BAMA_12495 [Bacillus manliponensis]|uniref:Uncharacterized protein n=1 Tax=Bacillus manliponensis TaxID=574376 RepID=A0A073JTN8_9BACI|nr:hypothetical protein [Bacillus manliponensis]KEK17551.1 hypothetical protein BAMA_12495 [Bacillus manliponensis]